MRGSGLYCFLLCSCLVSPGYAGDAADRARPSGRELDVDRVIVKMEDVRSSLVSLATEVVKTVPSDPGRPAETFRLFFRSPDRLRVEVGGARPRKAVINGDRLWVFHPDLEIVEQTALPDERARRRALYELSWGLTGPVQSLVRGMNRELKEDADGSLTVRLTPDSDEVSLDWIEARVDPATWLVREMRIKQPGLPLVRLEVADWDRETDLSESVFALEVPAGWDVFEELEPGPNPGL
ncbi:MAG TPA: outer-membrane lipoprotein carrier protein LolA [bacterium]|nr:outer-membrane lipoprotein carrier protein LolA [bacterium]HPQ65789.1 outer-membrane lipoprotein carrier protein LolA [bacterium]